MERLLLDVCVQAPPVSGRDHPAVRALVLQVWNRSAAPCRSRAHFVELELLVVFANAFSRGNINTRQMDNRTVQAARRAPRDRTNDAGRRLPNTSHVHRNAEPRYPQSFLHPFVDGGPKLNDEAVSLSQVRGYGYLEVFSC